jgi:hypothetical protein
MGLNGAMGAAGAAANAASEAEANQDEMRRREAYDKRVEVERQLRVYRYKGAVVAPPKDAVEYGERIQIL